MALYDDGCSGVLNRVHAQLLHVLPSSLFAMSSKCLQNVFKMRERRHGQMKNEIMNGNQGDHVPFV